MKEHRWFCQAIYEELVNLDSMHIQWKLNDVAVTKGYEINLKKRILAYSAKKINANPPPFSKLKPETSSDSPSAKSKEVRLISDKKEINIFFNLSN